MIINLNKVRILTILMLQQNWTNQEEMNTEGKVDMLFLLVTDTLLLLF